MSAVDQRIWSSRPAVSDGYGYLYVIEWDNNVVKVGKTTDPASRMSAHISQARAYRSKPIAVWFSDAHLGFSANESAAIAYLSRTRVGKQVRREYFHDADFGEVVDVVERICRGEDLAGQLTLLGTAETLNVMTTALPRVAQAIPARLTPEERVQIIEALIDTARQIIDLEQRLAEVEADFAVRDAAAGRVPFRRTPRDRTQRMSEMFLELGGMLARARVALSGAAN